MADEILFSDADGNEAMLRNGKVIYRAKVYTPISNEEAAERILREEEVSGCYIEAISRDTLLEAEERVHSGNLGEEDVLEPLGKPRVALRSSIRCPGCLIRSLDLGGFSSRAEIDFTWATFVEKAQFGGATLNGCVVFEGGVFRGGACFEHARFGHNANFSGATFAGKADFEGTSFAGQARFDGARLHAGADFKGTAFQKEARLKLADFGGQTNFANARFDMAADFERAIFRGEVSFRNATIRGRAQFYRAGFNRDADFSGATIGIGHFGQATFRGMARFGGATFNKKAELWHATFEAEADFSMATLGAEAEFAGANFGGEALFEGTTFAGEPSFIDVAFRQGAKFKGCRFLSCRLSRARFEKLCCLDETTAGRLDLRGAIFVEGLRLSPATDPNVVENFLCDVRVTILKRKESVVKNQGELARVQRAESLLNDWQGSARAIYLVNFEETLVQGDLRCDFEHLDPKRGSAVLAPHAWAEAPDEQSKRARRWGGSGKAKWPEDGFREAKKQYAWLKEHYRRRGAYGDEDRAHWWASECARRTSRRVDKRFAPLLPLLTASLFYCVLCPNLLSDAWPLLGALVFGVTLLSLPRTGQLVAYREVFGYGVRPWKIVRAIVFVIVLFAFVFWRAKCRGLILSDSPPALSSGFLNSLYFSVITFATVGYGDVRALGWAASAAMVEGLLGIVLNAALVVVIFRKLVR